jgi:hypothetical protein
MSPPHPSINVLSYAEFLLNCSVKLQRRSAANFEVTVANNGLVRHFVISKPRNSLLLSFFFLSDEELTGWADTLSAFLYTSISYHMIWYTSRVHERHILARVIVYYVELSHYARVAKFIMAALHGQSRIVLRLATSSSRWRRYSTFHSSVL